MEDNMTNIRDLIAERDSAYDTFTTAIITELANVTTAASSLVGEEFKDHLTWDSVSIIDDTLIVSGQLYFPVGHVIVSEDGDEVPVTEDTQKLFNRVVRVGVPVEMADAATEEEIIDYLKNMGGHEYHGANEPQVYEAENSAIETVSDIAGEFRSFGLSQEQIASMIVFAEQSKGKVN